MAILANAAEADVVVIEAAGDTRVLLIAGRPLNEAIAQYGPFVMNTDQEIYQALNDFRDGRLTLTCRLTFIQEKWYGRFLQGLSPGAGTLSLDARLAGGTSARFKPALRAVF